MCTRLELSLPAVPASIRDARNAAADAIVDLGASGLVVENVRLCVSEAVTNVVRHAYDDRGGDVRLLVGCDSGDFVVDVYDAGKGLSDFRQDGDLGYGLKIIEELADRCSFASAPHLGTHVEMAFAVGGPCRAASP